MARENRTPPGGSMGDGGSNSLRASGALGDESAIGLLRRLIDDVTALLRNEFALARAETIQAAQRAKGGAVGIALGAGVLLAGVLALVAAAILALAEVVEPWLAALIVGAVLALVGYVALRSGTKRLGTSSLRLERTQESLRKDRDTVTETMGSGRMQ